ncbi:putative 6-phosphofructo-2-kinase/fructose-2,6-bisphosphatase YLR345W [Trichomonascus vanleenenianus]|uniref:bifunctional fructose-2,6-bisphosphate 2-phosphatase/6-phosphofructo-2-kinase n=1 Tax=Trichomonascus vanleenenianus TaxID=2268995 RepID=UPI003ECB8679
MAAVNEGLLEAPVASERRRSSEVDGIHSVMSKSHISPAQLYATDSGRLFHAGKICIVLVGLPARGKTHHAVALTRYLRWLGVKTHAFHLGDYRRQLSPADFKVPDDYFMENASPATVEFRQRVLEACMCDIERFFEADSGQVAIYDAVNATARQRRRLAARLTARGVAVLFVECLCTDESIVIRNIRDVKLTSPDYANIDFDQAVRHYLRRIELRIPHYEPVNEPELSYVKLINVAEKVIINNAQRGYLHHRILFYLMNSQIKVGSLFFARSGHSTAKSDHDYKSDETLSEGGKHYAEQLWLTIARHLEERREKVLQMHRNQSIDRKLLRKVRYDHERSSEHGGPGEITPPVTSGTSTPLSSADARAVSTIRADEVNLHTISNLTVWSSTRKRTVETASYFAKHGLHTTQRTQLNLMNPGEAGVLTEAELKAKYPIEYENHKKNPYHHRYPRAESYHDVAVRMEPLIMEMERISGDLLIIAHESVLRVLYGYYMSLSVTEIPFLSFPRNEIVEIIPNAYINQSNRIPIPGVDP